MKIQPKGSHGFVNRWMTILLFIVIISFLTIIGCGNVKLSSQWKDHDIEIDGKIDDWRDELTYISKKKISVGLLNDDNFLYICLICGEPSLQMQVMTQGLIIWFDPHGGKEKTAGIKFPVGINKKDVEDIQYRMRPDTYEILNSFYETLNEIEILQQGEQRGPRRPVEKLKGLAAHAELKFGVLVCELKIPLEHKDEYSFSIGRENPFELGIGLETPKMILPEDKKFRPKDGENGIRIGAGPSRNIPGGGPGMRPPAGMKMNKPKPLKLWSKVTLAKAE